MTDVKTRILLVDDDKFLLDMYSMKFVQHGFEVQACLSVKHALDSLRKGFAPDVVLFDLIMPEMDGFQFLESMRAERLADKALKIALTNQSTDAEQHKVLELGGDRVLVKATLIPSEVVNTVETAIKARTSA